MPTYHLALPQIEKEITLQNQLDEYADWYVDWIAEQDYYSHSYLSCDRYAD